MKQKLELQADRIEHVLSLHRVSARVAGGTVTPRWIRFQVLPAMGAKISHIKNLHQEIAAALNAPNCRVSRRGAAIAVEVPRDDPHPVRFLPLFRQVNQNPDYPYPPIAATLGLADDGSPLLIRLPSPDVAHILVAGTTGSGKTVLLQAIILSLAMSNSPNDISLVLMDPKSSAFSPFKGLPHLSRPLITSIQEATETLHSLVHLMERRTTPNPQPHVILIIDELADLLLVGGKPIQWALTRLTQRGREASIHVIAATQKPTSAVIGTLVKANFPVRLVGKVMSVEDARVATGWSGSGAERLLGQGDFLAIAEGKVTRFQVARVTGPEIRERVARLCLCYGRQVQGPASACACPRSCRRAPADRCRSAPACACPRPCRRAPADRGRRGQAGLQAISQGNISPPPLTPARITPISSIHTLPAPPPQIDPNQYLDLVQRLITSHLWNDRLATNKTTYRWGWMSKICRFLFDHELEGTWDRKTRHILALAEISSTTTTTQAPGEGPRGGVVRLRK